MTQSATPATPESDRNAQRSSRRPGRPQSDRRARRRVRRKRLSAMVAALLGLTAVVAAPAAGSTAGTTAAPAWTPEPSFTSADNGDGTYSVPILASDVPDISVARVPAAESGEGRDVYYMVSTTMHLSPGAPIMKSYDLVNWEIVSYVYDRLSINDAFSMRNGQNSYGAGQWASSLRYHDGRFYVAFNTNNMGGAFIYSTDDIEDGAWDRIALGRSFHDMSLFFDEANGGTPYLVYGGVSIAQLSEDLTTVVADYPNVIDESDYPGATWSSGLVEGSQVFFIDGQYYIVTIAWPSGQNRQVVMFRSDHLLGKYATEGGENPYQARVALNSDGFAQGSLVPVDSDGDTDWWGMFFRDTYPLGRIPGLIPATWEDGWPTFGDQGTVRRGDSFDKPIALDPALELFEQQKAIVTSDGFENDAPHRAYQDQEWEIPEGPDIDPSLVGVELIDNAGFEDGTTGWIVNDTATLSVSDDARTGESAVLATGRTTTGSGPSQVLTGELQHGVTYDLSAWVKYTNPASPATKRFYVTARYGTGTYTNLATGVVNRGEWGRLTGTFTVPDAQALDSVRIFVETPWTSSPGTAPAEHLMDFAVDDVSLVGRASDKELPVAEEIAPNGSNLALPWEWNHAPDNRYWSLTERPGWLTLTNGHVVTGEAVYTKASQRELAYLEEARNTLSQRIAGPTASAQTTLDVSGMVDGDTAGLATYGRSFTYAAVRQEGGERTLGIATRLQPFTDSFDQDAAEAFKAGTQVDLGDATVVHLKQDADYTSPDGQLWVQFHYSLDGVTWQPLGARQGPLVMDWSLSHFMGYRFGLFNYATTQTGGSVAFDEFLLSDTLGTGTPDTGELEEAVAYAASLDEARYPDDAWADMEAALAPAQQVLAGAPATQNQVDAPTAALNYQLARLGTLETVPPLTLTDIATNPFKSEIEWLAATGITTGWDNGDGTAQFRPLQNVNRDQMAAFLYRMSGSPDFEDPAVPTFADVPAGHVFYTEIEWLATQGITNGWDVDGVKYFRPTTAVNRDVMAAFLYRYAGEPEFEGTAQTFVDVPSTHVFYDEVEWLATTGITNGWDVDGVKQFRPTTAVKRDVMAAFLYRYAQLA